MITLVKTSLFERFFLFFAIALVSMPASSAPLNLADTPLYLSTPVIPNVIMTLDDSLSMSHAHVPDALGHSAGGNNILSQRRYKSNFYNALYYSPFVTYPIPTRSDGTTYSTSFTAAYVNGLDSSKGSINLSNNYSVTFFYKPEVTAATYTNTSNCAFQSATATGTPVGGWGEDCMRARNPSLDFPSAQQNAGIPAYYYIFWSQQTGQSQPTNCTVTVAQQKEDEDCYIKINVGSTTLPVDLFAGTQAQQQQNFANWFSFYRTRALAVMSGVISSVNGLPRDAVRFAWQSLRPSGSGNCTQFSVNGCQGYITTNSENRMRPLDALKTGSATETHRTDFFNWMQRFQLRDITPLRQALENAGIYYTTSGLNSPYAEDPYITLGTEQACRKNYHVMFTDGLWNSNNNTPYGGNVDSTNDTMPGGRAYIAQYPFKNTGSAPPAGMSYSNSLADIAFNYWKTDLRTDLSNSLLPNIVEQSDADRSNISDEEYWNAKNDPATWQHMVNFTVGLGLSATLTDPAWGGSTYTGDYPALGGNPPYAATKFWPAINESPTLGNEPVGHVYDLWHAAINSRGQFFSVEDPIALQNAFQSIFSTIISTTSSAAAAASNSTSIQTGTVIYQAQFDSQNWSGHLYSFSVTSNGTVLDLNSDDKLDGSDANWDAATLIPAPASRNIRTFNGTAGVELVWGNLSSAQQTALKTSSAGVVGSDTMGQDRLNWLRGVATKEVRNSGIFRNRTVTVLGDIINSDPMLSHTEDYGYTSLPTTAAGQSTYAAFVSGKSSRPPMVYDGANDGMLHAFRADTGDANSGKELFAYVPAAVYGKLSSLTETDYSHKYFVDGSPTIGDAYLSAWKTVLVGGLGKGGKAIYALDISNPNAFADSHVLWEYSGSTAAATDGTGITDADGLGLTYSQPQIARLNDGTWVAIFGNGYNSTSERAFLYIVNLSTGALIKKIPTNTATSNGLSTPRLYDSNNDKIIDFVYAGDLQGNMWKFDLSGATSASWGLGNGGNPLFIARNSSNQIQPIIAQPTVGGHSSGGVLVYFGTGSYMTNTDVADATVQSFYAIWDKPSTSATVARSSLVQQSIIEEVAKGTTKTIAGCTDDPLIPGNECVVTFNFDLRATSKNTVDYTSKFGWYMDLLPLGGVAAGERVISSALLKHDRVIFLTRIPSADPCVPGGSSWLMEMDASTGGATVTSSFDFNNDGQFDDKDKSPLDNTVSGVGSNVGMVKATVWLENEGTGIARKLNSGATTMIETVTNRGGTGTPGGTTVNRLYWLQIQ
jgi:type IV pilus assembly protein PilY1